MVCLFFLHDTVRTFAETVHVHDHNHVLHVPAFRFDVRLNLSFRPRAGAACVGLVTTSLTAASVELLAGAKGIGISRYFIAFMCSSKICCRS